VQYCFVESRSQAASQHLATLAWRLEIHALRMDLYCSSADPEMDSEDVLYMFSLSASEKLNERSTQYKRGPLQFWQALPEFRRF